MWNVIAIVVIVGMLQFSAVGSQESRRHPLELDDRSGSYISGKKFGNTTVWAAMILTDPSVAGVTGDDFSQLNVSGTAVENAWIRVDHAQKMVAHLPFKAALWWSVYSHYCPYRPSSKTQKNERGVSLAHYHIWIDFEFQGRAGRDKDIANDRDVLIVFEDDSVITTKNVTASLEMEISNMTTDFKFLGWCFGNSDGEFPLCTHAYAITRRGVRNIIAGFDTCSELPIDGQLKSMTLSGVYRWAKASPESYKDMRAGFSDTDLTHGIFQQKKKFVSFNYHGFQNHL